MLTIYLSILTIITIRSSYFEEDNADFWSGAAGALGVEDNLDIPIPVCKVTELYKAVQAEHKRVGLPGLFVLDADVAAEARSDFDVCLRSICDRLSIDLTSA